MDEVDDSMSEVSHSFSAEKNKTSTHKAAVAQVREVVKDFVFPVAKFLRLEDLPHSNDEKSWCRRMADWCHIDKDSNKRELWWQAMKKVLISELQQQRSDKTNVIKREFFSKSFLSLHLQRTLTDTTSRLSQIG